MNSSLEWDRQYREAPNFGIWPWSDLVSYVMRYARPTGPNFRVIELGCGAGANIPFFLSLGVEYYGVEGSPTIVANLRERFPELKNNIVVGDFTLHIPFSGEFDLVVDRASLTHNATPAIVRCLDLIQGKLKPGGKFIGIDWFSTAYSDYLKGVPTEEEFTRTGYREGSFAGLGMVHFSDKSHLLDLFKCFDVMVLEHKTVQREIPASDWKFASWNMVACKTVALTSNVSDHVVI